MKIRNGFVSNSSSSSFMVVGHCFTEKDLQNAGVRHGIPLEDCCAYELKKKFPDLMFYSGISYYYDSWCVGLCYSDMKADETKAQFEERISERLAALTGTRQTVEELTDGGYDG